MTLSTTAEIVAAAVAAHRGVAAFNVVTVEQIEAVIAGAERAGLPAILQVSENAVRFHHGQLGAISAAAVAAAGGARVAMGLHLDHVTDGDLLREAPRHGYSSVMFDASACDYESNLRRTAEAVRFAHRHGLWLEAELGAVGGKDGQPPLPAHAPGARTDPAEAASFVHHTGVDALAVAVGSSHAMTTKVADLDHDLIVRLAEASPVPLVLHGSSGVPEDQLSRAVAAGITKVNIGTALSVAYTGAIREYLNSAAGRRSVDPRHYLALARDAVADTVADFVTLLAR